MAARRLMCTAARASPPAWSRPMPPEQFSRMRQTIAAPSPVGFEAAMTIGVLRPFLEGLPGAETWESRTFAGNAGLVVDTHPGREDLLTVMVCGHADKIRMQVRHVSDDGKIWIQSDSFLPLTLLGNHVVVFSEDPAHPGAYREVRGSTVEALGAIHFAEPAAREGKTGIKKEQLYLETGVHGEDKGAQVRALGIKAGDPIILDRPIEPAVFPGSFAGAYLDNGLGCFAAAEVAALIAGPGAAPLENVRVLFAFAAFEEIGRFGSRVLAAELKPDVLLAVDVNHDYKNAPNVGSKRMPPLEMGGGVSLSTGSVTSPHLNSLLQRAALDHGIPFQLDVRGADTGELTPAEQQRQRHAAPRSATQRHAASRSATQRHAAPRSATQARTSWQECRYVTDA